MNSLRYEDMIKKYHYYKNVVIKDYIKKGIYPNNSQIELAINRIDLALPILQGYNIHEGSKFDTAQYNKTLTQIYTDLLYLYELTYDVTVTRLNKFKSFLDTYVTDLNNKANTYYKRALIEKNSTALGDTILYETNVVPEVNNNRCIINFDKEFELYKGSKLACFLNADNIQDDDVIFQFTDIDSGNTYYGTVYNDNQYSFDVPGVLVSNIYNVNFDANTKLDSKTILSLSGSDYNINNKYKIYSGKNKMLIRNKETGECTVADIPINTTYYVDAHSFIEFYIIDGDSLTFTYNQKPLSANFKLTNNTIDTKVNNHVFMECDSDFAFSITLNQGTIYSYNNQSIYNNSSELIISNEHKLHDFLVYEYALKDNIANYNISVIINNIQNTQFFIDNIAIKELLPIK